MKVFIEFGAADDAQRAIEALRARGYRDIETYSPFPLTNEDAHAPRGSFLLALAGFFGGLIALGAAYAIQWYANAESYPLNIGGRPAHAVPAFVPAVFESICLFGAVGVFIAFLLFERLPRLWQPVFEIDGFHRASIDRFWVVLNVRTSTVLAERIAGEVQSLHPLRVIAAEGAL